MATVTRPRFDAAEMQRRVRHPLQSVRGTIRSYVILEGALVALLFLAVGFWISFGLDFSPFFLFGFDWLLELQDITGTSADVWLRGMLLTIFLGGLAVLVTYKVFFRLFREFRDESLALLLERRFPKELGDRLITAVELSDPRAAEKFGFSPQMVQQTIEEAADRVERLPVRQVFNWGRLWRLGLFTLLATLGVYLLVMIAGMIVIGVRAGEREDALHEAALKAGVGIPGDPHPDSVFDFFGRFNRAMGTWFRRNVLLRDEYWLRQAYLELVRFHDSPRHPGQMRVPEKSNRPDLGVRAYRWVTEDDSPPRQVRKEYDEQGVEQEVFKRIHYGWRPLTWADLETRAVGDEELAGLLKTAQAVPEVWHAWPVPVEDLDPSVPKSLVPTEWQDRTMGQILLLKNLKDPATTAQFDALARSGFTLAVQKLFNWRNWTADRIQLTLRSTPLRTALEREHPGTVKAFDLIFAHLENRAFGSDNRGRLRMLEVPDQVHFVFSPESGKSTFTSGHLEEMDEGLPARKFKISLGKLTESGSFTVHGGDYFLPTRKIMLVPPVTVTSLTQHLEEPAYFYYRLKEGPANLKGEKQALPPRSAPVAGAASTIDVKNGTNLTLTFETDRPLKGAVQVRAPENPRDKKAILPKEQPVLAPGASKFTLAFEDVNDPYEFHLDFIDEDHVKGEISVFIRPIPDEPPEVSHLEMRAFLRRPLITVIEKKTGKPREPQAGPDWFLITPEAVLPFRAHLKDDFGLAEVEWSYTLMPIDFEFERLETPKGKAPPLGLETLRHLARFGSAFQLMPGFDSSPLAGAFYLNYVERSMAINAKKRLPSFVRALNDLPLRDVAPGDLKKLLRTAPPTPAMIPNHPLTAEDDFHVGDFKLGSEDATKEGQLHYLLTLTLEAADTNIETGPSKAETRTPLTFLIVSENELLAQIALEEKALSKSLKAAEKTIGDLEEKLTNFKKELELRPAGENSELLAPRLRELGDSDFNAAASAIREAARAYERILSELQVNHVKEKKLDDIFTKIAVPLSELARPDGEVAVAEQGLFNLFSRLDKDVRAKAPGAAEQVTLTRDAQLAMKDLGTKLRRVLAQMEEELTWAKSLDLLITLERSQRLLVDSTRELVRIRQKEIEDLLK